LNQYSYQERRRDRPYDARQPVSDELAKVLIPTDSYLDLADKGGKLATATLFLAEEGFCFLLKKSSSSPVPS